MYDTITNVIEHIIAEVSIDEWRFEKDKKNQH